MKIILVFLVASFLSAQSTPSSQAWIEKSNRYTNLLLDVDKKYSPEEASSEGLAEYDAKISIPSLANEEAEEKENRAVLATLKEAAKTETDKNVSEDLAILIKATELNLRFQDYSRETLIPLVNPTRFVYMGI